VKARLALSCLLLLPALLQASAARADEEFPHGQLPDGIVPTHYSLELIIDPRQAGFSGTVAIDVTAAAPTRLIWLHGLGLTAVEARVESQGASIPATYREVDAVTGVARLDLDGEVPAGPATLHFRYQGGYCDGAEGLFLTQVGEDRYVFSQLQAIDARRVFPGFDEPRFKTPFDVTVRAIDGDRVIANTPLVSATSAPGGMVTHRFETTLPLPTYLLAFAVGPLDIVDAPAVPANEIRRHPLPLRGAATRGQGPRLAYALRNTAAMVEWLERYFDLPFPYPKLDLIASPRMGGAMENAGAILYGDDYLLFGDDAPPSQLRRYAETHAHELAHQWFGDLVTPTWWEDTWLNESFATWISYKVAAAWQPGLIDGIDLTRDAFGAMDLDSLNAGRPIREPVTDSRQILATFDSITYEKGGGVLAMFESYLGEEVFRKGVQVHLRRHLHGTATSADFFSAMAEAAGEPAIMDAFRSFVDQPGVPLVTVRRSADGRKLGLSQTRYRPIGSTLDAARSWRIPVCVAVYGAVLPAKRCTLLQSTSTELELPEGVTAVMPNADGAGYYRSSLDESALGQLTEIAATLPDREALALTDSLVAAFRAGRLPFTGLLAAARQLAAHPNRLVALSLGYELTDIRNRWAGPAERNALSAALTDMYAPRLAGLGLDPRAGAYAAEDPNRRLLRRSLASILVMDGNSTEMPGRLADAARRSLDDPTALDPEFRDIAWIVGVRQFGAGFAAAMSERVLNSPDPQVRAAAAAALGQAVDPEVSTAALALSLDSRIGINEMLTLAFRQLGQAETRDRAWPWLTRNFDAFHQKLPGFAQDVTYALPSSFCDAGHRREIAQFMEPAAAAARTGTLRVARTLERIDLCVAQRAALGPQVMEALGATLR
jgi:aminopeptidase N